MNIKLRRIAIEQVNINNRYRKLVIWPIRLYLLRIHKVDKIINPFKGNLHLEIRFKINFLNPLNWIIFVALFFVSMFCGGIINYFKELKLSYDEVYTIEIGDTLMEKYRLDKNVARNL